MSIIVKTEDGQGEQLFLKGAGEQVLGLCSKYMKADGSEAPLDDKLRESLEEYRAGKAREGFRLICLAYRELSPGAGYYEACPDTELTMLGFTSILDPLREEVPESVRICKGAGVRVIMVTGDHKDTAQYIAGQCGIYVEAEHGVVLEAHEFRRMYDEAFLAQHGSRLQRYCNVTEKIVDGEKKITLSPYLDEIGDDLDWRQAIGPICDKPVKVVMPGQKEKADEYEGFKGNLIRGNPQQLDAWAYGVKNIYDDVSWPGHVQVAVENLRVMAVKAFC